MRKVLLLAVTVVVLTSGLSSAANRPSRPQVRSNQNSVFGRLMEAERQKNAWLRKTFLGR